MKLVSLSLSALIGVSVAAGATPTTERAVTLTHHPLVMRLAKDEFRIAFGIDGERCADTGCNGAVRYRVNWKTVEGIRGSEIKHVNYVVPPRAGRTIAVDRQYFDTAEGQHTTDIVEVIVDAISCAEGVQPKGT